MRSSSFGWSSGLTPLLPRAAPYSSALESWLPRRIGLRRTVLVGHARSSLLLIASGFAPSFARAAACLFLRDFCRSLMCLREQPSFSCRIFRPRRELHPVAIQSGGCRAPMSGRLLSVSAHIGWHLVAAGCVWLICAFLFCESSDLPRRSSG